MTNRFNPGGCICAVLLVVISIATCAANGAADTGTTNPCSDHVLVNEQIAKTVKLYPSSVSTGMGTRQIRWELDNGQIFDSYAVDFGKLAEPGDYKHDYKSFLRPSGTNITLCHFKSKMDGTVRYSLRIPGDWPGKDDIGGSLPVTREQ